MYNTYTYNTCIPTYLPTYLPTHPPTYLPTYLRTYPPTYLPAYPTCVHTIRTHICTYIHPYIPTSMPVLTWPSLTLHYLSAHCITLHALHYITSQSITTTIYHLPLPYTNIFVYTHIDTHTLELRIHVDVASYSKRQISEPCVPSCSALQYLLTAKK